MTCPNQNNRGFTLLEVMVALAISTALMAILYGVFFQGVKTWHSLTSDSDSKLQAHLIRQHLRHQIQNALLIKESTHRESPIVFRGDEEQLEFIARLSPLQGDAGLYRYRLQLLSDPPALNIRITPYGSGDSLSEQQLSLETDYPLHFRYSDSSGSTVTWLDSWPYNTRLPHLISLEQKDTDTPDWLPLTVASRRHRHAG